MIEFKNAEELSRAEYVTDEGQQIVTSLLQEPQQYNFYNIRGALHLTGADIDAIRKALLVAKDIERLKVGYSWWTNHRDAGPCSLAWLIRLLYWNQGIRYITMEITFYEWICVLFPKTRASLMMLVAAEPADE